MSGIRFFTCWMFAAAAGLCAGVVVNTAWANAMVVFGLAAIIIATDAVVDAVKGKEAK